MDLHEIEKRAAIDEEFRERLYADPSAVLAAEGIDVSELPVTDDVELAEDRLAHGAAGGNGFWNHVRRDIDKRVKAAEEADLEAEYRMR
jgi:hypothetical protein